MGKLGKMGLIINKPPKIPPKLGRPIFGREEVGRPRGNLPLGPKKPWN